MSMLTPNPKPLLCRLWAYQAERFPLVALLPTTAAVLYSTWAIMADQGLSQPLWKFAALGVAGISSLLHTRIIDELRHRDVDDLHHPDRPLPRADFTLVNNNDISTLDLHRMSWMQDLRVASALYEAVPGEHDVGRHPEGVHYFEPPGTEPPPPVSEPEMMEEAPPHGRLLTL